MQAAYYPAMATSEEVSEALGWMESAKDIHNDYVLVLRGEELPEGIDREDPHGPVGNADWHEEWVRRYERVSALLKELQRRMAQPAAGAQQESPRLSRVRFACGCWRVVERTRTAFFMVCSRHTAVVSGCDAVEGMLVPAWKSEYGMVVHSGHRCPAASLDNGLSGWMMVTVAVDAWGQEDSTSTPSTRCRQCGTRLWMRMEDGPPEGYLLPPYRK